VIVAEVIAEKTRDSDIDKDQRFGEATSMAQKATQTVDTDISVPAGAPQDKIDAYKALLRSQAYSILGTIEFKKENFPGAQDYLQKSIDVYPSDPDPVVILRLALALDKQGKYPDALKAANRVVGMTQENTPIGTPARANATACSNSLERGPGLQLRLRRSRRLRRRTSRRCPETGLCLVSQRHRLRRGARETRQPASLPNSV